MLGMKPFFSLSVNLINAPSLPPSLPPSFPYQYLNDAKAAKAIKHGGRSLFPSHYPSVVGASQEGGQAGEKQKKAALQKAQTALQTGQDNEVRDMHIWYRKTMDGKRMKISSSAAAAEYSP
jgi:hypothetical protein